MTEQTTTGDEMPSSESLFDPVPDDETGFAVHSGALAVDADGEIGRAHV